MIVLFLGIEEKRILVFLAASVWHRVSGSLSTEVKWKE
jgi:hypothetical protein